MTYRTRLVLALAPAMLLPFFAALLYFVILGEHPVARGLYTATKVFTVVWPLFCVAWILRTGLPRPDPCHPRHRRALPLGVALGLGTAAIVAALFQSPVGAVVLASAPRIQAKAQALGIIEHYWTFALFLSLLHSLIEEYYWRWFVYGQLRHLLGSTPATLLAAAAFTAHHVVIATQFFPVGWALAGSAAIFAAGILWCAMFERQRTIAGAWIMHVLADLAIMAVGAKLILG